MFDLVQQEEAGSQLPLEQVPITAEDNYNAVFNLKSMNHKQRQAFSDNQLPAGASQAKPIVRGGSHSLKV